MARKDLGQSEELLFLWVNTKENILNRQRKPERQPKAYRKYTKNVKRLKRAKQEGKQKPHLEPIQSKKSIKDKGSASIYNFIQYHKLHTKEYFNLCTENPSSSNAILFLSFHTAQKRQEGASFQAFLRFLSTKDPNQPKRVSLTKQGSTRVTPKRANNNSHKTLVFMQ